MAHSFLLFSLSCDTLDAPFFSSWLSESDSKSCNQYTAKIVHELRKLAPTCAELEEIYAEAPLLAVQSRWIVGKDEWAYDIGYSGLHHILASGENINVLILETEP